MSIPKRLKELEDMVIVEGNQIPGYGMIVTNVCLDPVKFLLGFAIIRNNPSKDEIIFLIDGLIRSGNFFNNFDEDKRKVLFREKKDILWGLLNEEKTCLANKYSVYTHTNEWVASMKNFYSFGDSYIMPSNYENIISFFRAVVGEEMNDDLELVRNSFRETVYKIPRNKKPEELIDFSNFSLLEQMTLRGLLVSEIVNKIKKNDLEKYKVKDTDYFDPKDQEDFFFFRIENESLIECSKGFLKRGYKKPIVI